MKPIEEKIMKKLREIRQILVDNDNDLYLFMTISKEGTITLLSDPRSEKRIDVYEQLKSKEKAI